MSEQLVVLHPPEYLNHTQHVLKEDYQGDNAKGLIKL